MFGKNKIMQPEHGDGSELKVVNIFKTIQGEGPFAGTPAIFIRLGGCNLACKFCDTEFDDYQSLSTSNIIKKVENLAINNTGKINLVVITGGEPMRQVINPLCESLLQKNYKIQIETNGTIFRKLPKEVSIVCSPKMSNGKYHITKDLEEYVSCFKFIISKDHIKYNHIPKLETNKEIYIQPMDEYDPAKNIENQNYSIELALKYNYKLSLQIHKILNLE